MVIQSVSLRNSAGAYIDRLLSARNGARDHPGQHSPSIVFTLQNYPGPVPTHFSTPHALLHKSQRVGRVEVHLREAVQPCSISELGWKMVETALKGELVGGRSILNERRSNCKTS